MSACRTVGAHSHCSSVRRDPVVGRYACADRDIAPLEVVLAELPAVVTPQTRHGAVCLVCLKKTKEMGCCELCGLPVCGGEQGKMCR